MKLSLFCLAALSMVSSVTVFSQEVVPVDTTVVPAFEKVDSEAAFTGGSEAWKKYLQRNLKAEIPVDNGAPAGYFAVLVQFIVDKDGSLSNIKAITNLGYGMEEEVIRIIRKSGQWIPAMLHGRPVKAYRKQPVIFMVIDEHFEIITSSPYTLYTKTDNELTVDAGKTKKDDLRLTISEGTITSSGNGKFTARVSKSGRVLIELFDTKKNKKIGAASFEVKTGK